jgi:hypothetical protein
MKISDILRENASAGSTASGSIASVPGAGGPMMAAIRRMLPGQSFFAPVETTSTNKSSKKRVKTTK